MCILINWLLRSQLIWIYTIFRKQKCMQFLNGKLLFLLFDSFRDFSGYTLFSKTDMYANFEWKGFFLLLLIFYFPSTIFQSCRDMSSWVEPVLSLDWCVLLKDTRQWCRWAQTHSPSVSSQALYHWATALHNGRVKRASYFGDMLTTKVQTSLHIHSLISIFPAILLL